MHKDHVHKLFNTLLKFIYSEKSTKSCEISILLLTVCTVFKSKMEILQNFVAFSEYLNFNSMSCYLPCALWHVSCKYA